MISYTPGHEYSEVIDEPIEKSSISRRLLNRFISIVIVSCIIWGIILCFKYLSLWNSIIITLIVLALGVIFLFFYTIFHYKSPSKSTVARVIKSVIGYDFGDDFRLLYTASHDYEEYLYIFSKESFEPFRLYLESVQDNDGNETGRSIEHEKDGKHCFYLCENRLKDGCGNVESITVDYEERTLRHKFVIY